MKSLVKKGLEFLLAGGLFLGSLGVGHAQDQQYGNYQIRNKPFTAAQKDSIKLRTMIMPVMQDRSYIFNEPYKVNIWGKDRQFRIAIKKPHEALEFYVFIDSTDVFDDVYLDHSTAYVIHKDRSAFTFEDFSLVLYPKIMHWVNYVETGDEVNPDNPQILKETEDFIFSTFSKVVNKTTLRALFGFMDFNQFVRDFYQRGKAIEMGNLEYKAPIYIEERLIEPVAFLIDLPQKKLHREVVSRGEKSIDAMAFFIAVKADGGIGNLVGQRVYANPVFIKLKD